MAALGNAFGSLDGVTSQIGFGQAPGFDALQRQASQIGFGSALGFGQPQGVGTQIGFGGVPGSIRGEARSIGGYDDFLHGTYGSYLQGIQDEWNSLMSEVPGGAGFGGVGSVTSPGGDWASVDQWDAYVVEASRQFGIPGNLLKAIMRLESGGNPSTVHPVSGATGLMQVMPEYWGNKGYDIYSTRGNVMAGGYALKSMYDQHLAWAQQNGMDPWEAATRAYLAGNPWSTAKDANGTDANSYWAVISGHLNELGGMGTAGAVNTGSATGNSVVQLALEFVGKVPYDWGGIPGKGVDPLTTSGWDCSGFTYWLDQNYGSGQLPAGSHYQYQWAADTGQLFTNQQQLQPGDLVFFDTGLRGGGGAHLNGASHVGVYIGNGQMLHAANPSQGTIVSDFNSYTQMYPYLGGLHMSWSGGAAGVPGQGGGGGGGYAQPMSQNQILTALLLGRPVPGYTA